MSFVFITQESLDVTRILSICCMYLPAMLRSTNCPASWYFSGYIPGYLRYIMVEVLKNSFKATLAGATAAEIAERPIHVLICQWLSNFC